MPTISFTLADLDNEMLKQSPLLWNYQDYQARRMRELNATLATYQETLAQADDFFVRKNIFASPIAIGTAKVTTTTGDIYTVAPPTDFRRVAGDAIMVSKAASPDFCNVPRMTWEAIVASGSSQTPYAFWEENGQIVIYDKDGANFDNASNVNFSYYRQLAPIAAAVTNLAPAAASAYSWNDVTGTSQTMAPGNAYVANNASLVTLSLPANFAIGDRFLIVGQGAGGWKIAQQTGEQINFLGGNSTNGTSGYLESTRVTDVVELVAIGPLTLQVVSATGLVQNDLAVFVAPGPNSPTLDIKPQDFMSIVTVVLSTM
jgi:hypothetical protein